MAFTQEDVNNWFTANPNATTTDVARAVQGLGGLEANQGLAGMIGQHYGTDAATVNNAYNQWVNPVAATPTVAAPVATAPVATTPDYSSLINNAYAGIGRTGIGRDTSNIDQGGFDYWKSQLASGAITPENFQATFNNAVDVYKRDHPTDAYTNYVNNWQKTQAENTQIKDYVANVLADKALTPWEQANKIMEQAQKAGVDQARLESIYGKEAVAPYMDTYRKGITSFLEDTLAKEQGTTMNEVGAIHQAAAKYGMTPDEIAKYGNLDPKVVQSYFDMYDKGLGTIVANLNDPKTTDLQKTQTALALGQKFGTTDAEIAKASNGKWTEKDVKTYLDPIRNVPGNLQKLFDDPNATAADIQKFVEDAKKDPRAAGIYGAALDKVTVNQPALLLRDAANGNNASENYQKFLAMAKSTPELATQYAPQIKAVEQALSVTARARDKDFGGKVPDYAMEMFLGLDKKTQAAAPKALEMTAPKTETRTGFNEDGQPYTYKVTTPPDVKTKGIQTLSDEDGNVTGYTKKVDTGPFKNLYANYDTNGKLTGYDDRSSRVHVSDPQYYYAKFDANGAPVPGTGANRSGGFLKNTLQDVASLGPVGQIALMAATGGLGSLAAGSLMSAGLSQAAANALGAGLVSGTLSEVGGGNFGKGFAGGAVGSGVSNLAGSYMPTNMTGSPMVDAYLAKALPTAAGSMARTGVMGGSLADAGLYSLLNTGVNMGTNELIQNTPLSTLDPSVRPYATGVASNLISSTLAGKNPNVQNALTNTMLQQVMKPAAKP